jgi:stage III sporulation protein AF
MEFLRGWVKDITIMFILISVVELALPNSNMKRYINMVIGFMIIVAIISPFIRLINSNFNVEREIFKSMIDEVKFQYEEDFELQDLQKSQIKETYLNKLKESVKESINGVLDYEVNDVKISIYEDEKNYGNIKDIEIVMKPRDGDNTHDEDTIKTIKIEEIRINDLHKEVEEDDLKPFENDDKIKDILNEKYNIPKENIKILIKNN